VEANNETCHYIKENEEVFATPEHCHDCYQIYEKQHKIQTHIEMNNVTKWK